MLHLVTSENIHRYRDELDRASALRHRDRLGTGDWADFMRRDDYRLDAFEREHAIYMLITERDDVVGYQRMLLTTRRRMCEKMGLHLVDPTSVSGERIWQWTHYSVDGRGFGGRFDRCLISNALISGVVEWGLQNNVASVVARINPLWVVRLIQLYFFATPLGFRQDCRLPDVATVAIHFDWRTLARLRHLRGDDAAALPDIPVRETKPDLISA